MESAERGKRNSAILNCSSANSALGAVERSDTEQLLTLNKSSKPSYIRFENMSEVADSVAISTAEDVMLGDSSLPEEANRMAIPSGQGLQLGDSLQPQQQEITIDHGPHMSIDELGDSLEPQQQEISIDNHGPHMSIDELLKVIKGANGMPVLFAPSSDGRLAAVAVDGLDNLIPANPGTYGSGEKKQQDFHSWLLLMASLVATVTFTAGLTPPDGFWAVDDKANGYIAGASVMHDKFRYRYYVFHFSNTTAFFASLMVIGMLAKNKVTVLHNKHFRTLVGISEPYIAGTSANLAQSVFSTTVFVAVLVCFSMNWFLDFFASIQKCNRSPQSIA